MVAAKQNKNTINGLTDAEGHRLTSPTQISEEAVGYFEKLIGTRDENVEGCPEEILEELLPGLPEEASMELISPITSEEIKKSMFSIDGEKAPGPDGFTSHFFKIAWPIVGREVENAVQYFFHTSKLLPAFNSTIIALVPKCQNPNSIKDFRPISCCNVIYKCITKILVNRMKKYLPAIIGRNQSAFIPGRSITDNILMAQELVRGYGRTTLSPRCAIKVDLQKAFDTVSWEFIIEVLNVLKFPGLFVDWIKSCLTGSRFSISINGGLVGYFRGARGLRQGDPMSPYLFVLSINVLSKLLDTAVEHRVFDYHPKCKRIKLTHLCFADDLLIFAKGNIDSVIGIQNVLRLFYSYSGLQLNNSKSEFFSSGLTTESLERIREVAGFKIGKLPVRYLGVPLVARRLTVKDCDPLIEKITARVNCWSARLLSYAGRLQLIQAVLFSMQNYWCRFFILPKRILKRIAQICSSYLWKGRETKAKGAKVSWQAICHPKSEGGLGLKDMYTWNQACLIQNIWAIIMQSGSLWIAWLQEYVLQGRSFWQQTTTSYSSWSWKKLLKLRPLVHELVEWKDGRANWKNSSEKYKAADVWTVIRPRREKVIWHKLVWYHLTVPKHAFISWMAILNRLPTMDRLRSWGMEMDGVCAMCKQDMETRNHLFFTCTFSKEIWQKILQLCRLSRRVLGWEHEFAWVVKKLKGKALITSILKVSWNACIYYVWKERNHRIFSQKEETAEKILEHIKEVVRIRLAKMKNVEADDVNRQLYSTWNLYDSIFFDSTS